MTLDTLSMLIKQLSDTGDTVISQSAAREQNTCFSLDECNSINYEADERKNLSKTKSHIDSTRSKSNAYSSDNESPPSRSSDLGARLLNEKLVQRRIASPSILKL